MAQDPPSYKVGDEFGVSTWGRLTRQEIAQYGVETLVGMLRAWHVNCPMPTRIFVKAELYQAGNPDGEHYIACYFTSADFDERGVPVLSPQPSLKALLQRLDNGQVWAQVGRIDSSRSDEFIGDFGLLDRSTVEMIMVSPTRIPSIPISDDESVSYFFQRVENVWQVACLVGANQSSDRAHAEVIGSFPVPAEPSPFTVIDLRNSPLG